MGRVTSIANDGGNASLHTRWYKSWIYSSRAVADIDDPSKILWSYNRGHEQLETIHMEGDLTTRSHWGLWSGLNLRRCRRVPGR